jgi:ribose transport system ATP-binding protein
MADDGAAVEPSAAPLLVAEGIGKSYGANTVLSGVDIEIHDREVLGVVGENGAGKSTLLNILSGVVPPDTGRLLLRGQEVRLKNYRDANFNGIFRVFQELALVPGLRVYENLFLTHEKRFSNYGFINHAAMRRRASAYLEEFEHGWIDPTKPIDSYSFSVRQIVEIIKAFALADLLETPSPVLLLDEPTAGLLADETEFFFRVVKQARKKTGIVYVGHRLGELLDNSDQVVVIKDGNLVARGSARDMTEEQLHQVMVGRARSEFLYHEDRQQPTTATTPILSVEGLSQPRAFSDVSFDVRPGEIIGIAGVIGSGKSELGRAIFGAGTDIAGEVRVGKQVVSTISATTQAGMGYVPQDRAAEGALLPQPVSWNISLARLSTEGGLGAGVMDGRREKRDADKYVDLLKIKTPGIQTAVGRLSGGNQQKVILGRWLAAGSKVLILDNPTRGVDVGAKEHIYSLLREQVANGLAVVLISDDLLELIMMSSQIHIMSGGSVRATIQTPPEAKPTEVEMVAHMV